MILIPWCAVMPPGRWNGFEAIKKEMRAWAAETGKEKGLVAAEAFKVMVLVEELIFRCSLFCAQVTEFQSPDGGYPARWYNLGHDRR